MKTSITHWLGWGEEAPYEVIIRDGGRIRPSTHYEIWIEQISTSIPRLLIAHGSVVMISANVEEDKRIVAPHQIREVGHSKYPETLAEACKLHEKMKKKLEDLLAEHDAQVQQEAAP